MTDEQDPRMAFVYLVKEHLTSVHVQNIAKILVSDQHSSFWEAPFSHSSGRWDVKGGLALATLSGYRALRFLTATANQLFTKVDEDRLVAIYLVLMVSRWYNIKTNQVTFERNQPASATSVAIANAITIGLDLNPSEVQALSRWYSSRSEMLKDHEGFTPEWWVIAETMNWIFIGNRR